MNLTDLENKKILIVGLGREAKSFISFLDRQNINCKIAIADKGGLEESPGDIAVYSGPQYLDNLSFFDIVFKSPGVPSSELRNYFLTHPDSILTSGTALFFEKHRDRIIGITGTKGKSTTSSLIYHLMKVAGFKVVLAGNIGLPMLDVYDEEPDYFVLELSSYQLEDLKISPKRAVFLNIYKEHLDYHGGFENYLEAKSGIFRNQVEGDLLVISKEIVERGGCEALRSQVRVCNSEESYPVGAREILGLSDLPLKGEKNLDNILAALTVLEEFNIPVEKLVEGVKSFKPLKHRLEEVGVIGGVLYVNDSIATVPEACMNAIDVYRESLDAIILGGFDRGLDFSELARKVVEVGLRNVILFLPSGKRIREEIERRDGGGLNFFEVSSMEEAVRIAKEKTKKGGTCLLSPASPSFPIFKNFEERGERFRDALRCSESLDESI